MMRRLSLALLALLVLTAFAASAAAGPYDKYLTPADIMKVTGLTGVKQVPKNPQKGAGGDLNYAKSDGTLLLMVQIVDKSQYKGYKDMYFKAAVQGVGDQAMTGVMMKGSDPNLFVFTKGAKCVALTAFWNPLSNPMKSYLTIKQLEEIAKIMAGRM